MLARIGWIAAALAAGLLLQIAVQINMLHWLPDFPVYLGLALLAAATALAAAPLALVSTPQQASAATARPVVPLWLPRLIVSASSVLAIAHAALALGSSSTAIEWWRNAALWPALLMGVSTCVLTGPRWKSLLIILLLGEGAAALLGCWYAPNSGEPQSLRGYQYVLAAALVSVVALLAAIAAEPRLCRDWLVWALVLASAALGVVCLARPDTEQAQPLMLGVAALRLALLVVAANRWLKLAAQNPAPFARKP